MSEDISYSDFVCGFGFGVQFTRCLQPRLPFSLHQQMVEDAASVSSGQQRVGVSEVRTLSVLFFGSRWWCGSLDIRDWPVSSSWKYYVDTGAFRRISG